MLVALGADHVVGLGGYVSVPAARAAIGLGIPLSLIEQNTVPGRATRFLAPCAERVFLGWSEARARLRSRCVDVTGVPIRARFRELSEIRASLSPASACSDGRRSALNAAPRLLVVLGGSLGARPLNEQAPLAIAAAQSALVGWRVVHQTGEPHLATTAEVYDRRGVAACVTPFVDDMPALLSGASLVVTRAGGSTLAELAALGVPSIVLPLLTSTDDHQRHNARAFAAAGAGLEIEAASFVEPLAEALRVLSSDTGPRESMSLAARSLAQPAAAEHIARAILQSVLAPPRPVRSVCKGSRANEPGLLRRFP